MKAMNLKAISNEVVSAGPRLLEDEELGTVAGGCGYEKKRRHPRTTRRTTRRCTSRFVRIGLVD